MVARSLVRPVLVRLGVFLATLVGAALFVQLLLAAAPGNAIDLLPNADALRPVLAAEWGLDEPLPTRLARTVSNLARGDLGTSLTYRPGAPVAGLVAQAGARSLPLLAGALVLSCGAALGLAWSGRAGLARPLQALSVVPAFLAAFLVVTALNAAAWAGMERAWWPRPGWFALPDEPSALRTVVALVVLAGASGNLAELHQVFDHALARLRAAPFVDAARARGESVLPHLVANLAPTVLDVGATRVAALLSSLVVVEKLLLLPGAGSMLWSACLARDVPLAMGVAVGAAALVALVRLAADLARLALDPRLRAAG